MAPNWPQYGETIMTSQFYDIKASTIFLDVVVILLTGLVTGLSFMSISLLVMTIFTYKGLIRNPEIGNTPV